LKEGRFKETQKRTKRAGEGGSTQQEGKGDSKCSERGEKKGQLVEQMVKNQKKWIRMPGPNHELNQTPEQLPRPGDGSQEKTIKGSTFKRGQKKREEKLGRA